MRLRARTRRYPFYPPIVCAPAHRAPLPPRARDERARVTAPQSSAAPPGRPLSRTRVPRANGYSFAGADVSCCAALQFSPMRIALGELLDPEVGAVSETSRAGLQALAYPAAVGRAVVRGMRGRRMPRIPKYNADLLTSYKTSKVRDVIRGALASSEAVAGEKEENKRWTELLCGCFLALCGGITAPLHPPKLCFFGAALVAFVVYKSGGALTPTPGLASCLLLGLVCIMPRPAPRRLPARAQTQTQGQAAHAKKAGGGSAKKAKRKARKDA